MSKILLEISFFCVIFCEFRNWNFSAIFFGKNFLFVFFFIPPLIFYLLFYVFFYSLSKIVLLSMKLCRRRQFVNKKSLCNVERKNSWFTIKLIIKLIYNLIYNLIVRHWWLVSIEMRNSRLL